MILEVSRIVGDLLGGRLPARPTSVIRLQATRTLFLVFAAQSERPLCIAQFGPTEELHKVHEVMAALHRAVPDLVPESMYSGHWRHGTWVHIQSGMPGLPWFRLAADCDTPRAWLQLRFRAQEALERLHAAVRSRACWRRIVNPGDELRQQAQTARACSLPLSGTSWRRIDAAAEHLGDLGSIEWFWQHGDYCLNNLLISDSRIGIVDFEDFGETAVPLHDEFGLALSLLEFMPMFAHRPSLAGHMAAIATSALSSLPGLRAHVDGLLLHHLLWRINQCRAKPSRRDAQDRLVQQVEQFARGPGEFFEALARESSLQ